MVCLVWRTIIVVGLSHHKDVVTTSEGVFEDGSRAEVDIRVVTLSLVGRGAVEVPLAELANVGDLLANGLLYRISLMSREHIYICALCTAYRRLRTQLSIAINPDICR